MIFDGPAEGRDPVFFSNDNKVCNGQGVFQMSKYWSVIARNINPYTPGEQPKDKKYIKLNTNENPYPPSPRCISALRETVNDDLKLYPDPTCGDLRDVIAKRHGLSVDQVFAGNGSDEILAFAFLAFFDPGKVILIPDITYSFYPVYADLFQIKFDTVALREDFTLPIEPFCRKNFGIVIANPNAPTGRYVPLEDIRTILTANMDVVVIIDEAYIAFGGESAVGLIDEFPNLLVIHTLSKSHSLAGLRVGYAMGSRELTDGLERMKNSFNNYTLDRLALKGAMEALKDEDYFIMTREKVIRTRERVSRELSLMGFQFPESKANFLFITHPRLKGVDLFTRLRDKGILVRYFDKPKITNYLRVSIGLDSEMDAVIKILREIVDV